MAKAQRIYVVSDLHAPFHDVQAWRCMLEAIREDKPATVVIIGDFADCYAVSSHPKSLERRGDFAAEVEAVGVELTALRTAAGPACRIVYCEGNHEDRITRFLQSRAPELGGLAGLKTPELLRLKARKIEWVPYRKHIWIGKCAFTHEIGRCGVNAARQSVLDFGGNVVIGHTHRGAIAYQGETRGRSHFCLNVGWLGDVDALDYMHHSRARRDWQTGFGIVDQDYCGYSWAQFVPVIGGVAMVDGVIVSGRVA